MKENDTLMETSKLNKEAKERYENELNLLKDGDSNSTAKLNEIEDSLKKVTTGLATFSIPLVKWSWW